MSHAWPALLGAIVGGLFTLAGAMALELRRERRRQLGGARLVLSELERSEIEVGVLSDMDRDGWLEGPLKAIRTEAWQASAADLIGRLTPTDFDRVDRAHAHLSQASEWGLTWQEATESLPDEIAVAEAVVRGLVTPTWFDRHVWRL
jgi:hypothetical protein